MPGPAPPAEVDVDEPLVRALLAEQHPDLAGELAPLSEGFDNSVWRLGHDLVVRLPRRRLGAELIEVEQRWLPELAARLPLPVPTPVRVGRPALGYPWRWSVCPYLPGALAADRPPAPAGAAVALGGFLAALHVGVPDDAPTNPHRGGPLAGRRDLLEGHLGAVVGLVDRGRVLEVWRSAAEAPAWDGPPVWLHGDLHPLNLLVVDDRISGVLDFGDLTAGDPATDLAVAWMLLDEPGRGLVRDAAGRGPLGPVDDATWARARGWALALGIAFLAHSAQDERMARIARRTLGAVGVPVGGPPAPPASP